jgi:hypothetical protein
VLAGCKERSCKPRSPHDFPKCKCMCLLSPISFAPNTSKQGGGRATVHGRPRGGAGDGVVVNVNKGRERDDGKD